MLNLLKDVFSSLQRHKVRYIVIGGIAAVLHGVPRATFDLHILHPTPLFEEKRDPGSQALIPNAADPLLHDRPRAR
jgi:hypothetical protein